MPTLHLFLVSAGFNLFWLLVVIGQNALIIAPALLLLVSWHCFAGAWRFALVLSVPGILMDYLLTRAGVYQFESGSFPFWLGVLWLGFSSFVWILREEILKRSPLLMMAFGGVGGTLSYLAGERLEAVILPMGIGYSAAGIMICWVAFSVIIIGLLRFFSSIQAVKDRESVE